MGIEVIFEVTHLRCEGCPSYCAKHANTVNGKISSMGIYLENVKGDSPLFCGIHPFDLLQCGVDFRHLFGFLLLRPTEP